MSLLVVDRFYPQQRNILQAAVDAGQLRKRDEIALLEPEQLRPLALLSLLLLIIGGIFFLTLNLAAYYWRRHTLPLHLSFWEIVLWLVVNLVGYIVILLVHEGLHALMFLFWGGKPYFGAKLPLALYCGAKDQLFRRDQYLAVGLAPLAVITLAGVCLTLFTPVLASYTLFATIGNCSGAAGDLWVAVRLMRYPASQLVEDTEAGYRAWEIADHSA
jgi:hypothetical protein